MSTMGRGRVPVSTEPNPFHLETVESESFLPKIEKFQAVVINNFQVRLYWGFSDDVGSSMNINDYEFYIERSYSDVDSEFEIVTEPLVGFAEFLDEPPNLLSKWRRLFYRLKMVHIASGEFAYAGPASIHEGTMPTQHAIAIIRRHTMYLSRFPVGSLCYAFIQRQFGPRCNCWNPVRGRTNDDECPDCFGTGFVHPYMEVPIRCYVNLTPDVEIIQQLDFEIEGDEKQAWTMNYPDFKKRDVLLFPSRNNSMYRVHNGKWLAQEPSGVGVMKGLHLIPVYPTEVEAIRLGFRISEASIKDYMDISWQNSRKTYFGCRVGGPIRDVTRRHTDDFNF